MASPITAANAYASLAKLTSPGTGAGQSPESGGPSFAAMLKDALGSVFAGAGVHPNSGADAGVRAEKPRVFRAPAAGAAVHGGCASQPYDADIVANHRRLMHSPSHTGIAGFKCPFESEVREGEPAR